MEAEQADEEALRRRYGIAKKVEPRKTTKTKSDVVDTDAFETDI